MSIENKHTREELKQYQSLSLESKIHMTAARVKGWINEFGEDGVYISFSGGKDSTVLMDVIRNQMGYNIPAVFVNVPTQYPELKDFTKTWDNVEILQPRMSFYDICDKYGFPLISKDVSRAIHDVKHLGENCFAYKTISGQMKGSLYNKEKWKFLVDAPFNISNKCCEFLKKKPLHKFTNENKMFPITAQMADESAQRTTQWMKNGCNGFNMKNPISNPMSFWTEQDVLQYINDYKLPICSVYGDVIEEDGTFKTTGCNRTGCMLCGYGCYMKKDQNRFIDLKETHPKMYSLLDIMQNNGVTFREAIEWTNEHGNLNIKI